MRTSKSISTAFLTLLLYVSLLLLGSGTATAQLPQDVRDVFEGMLDELDGDLRTKFEQAIQNDTATVEFNAEEFERFRNHPVNPFEGLDQIVIGDSETRIALKFELPSMRNRPLNRFERQHQDVLTQVQPAVQTASQCTVKILGQQRHIAMGTIIRSDGYVLTKASEVADHQQLHCQLKDGQELPASLVRTDSLNDLAILKINAVDLPSVVWSETPVSTGAFVLTPGANGKVLSLGTYSVPPRSTAEGKQAFLGVQPETTRNGVRVSDIRPGTSSFNAGLVDGDVISKLDGRAIPDVASLVKTIRDREPGDTVEIEFLRNGTRSITRATLAARHHSGDQAKRFKMMNRLGAVPSRRDDNFPTVFQHDSPLFPEQCGGPITDLDGNVIGINIARQGRAASYAIPSSHLKTVLLDLMRDNVATR